MMLLSGGTPALMIMEECLPDADDKSKDFIYELAKLFRSNGVR